MYSYSEIIPLTMSNVLERVTEEEIFELALGFKPVEHSRIVSPFREDDTIPGCFFSYYNGKLWFVDFADDIRHRDCFNMLQDLLGLSFKKTLNYINEKLDLGLGSQTLKIEATPIKNPSRVIATTKESIPRDIEFKPRDFNVKDRVFWSKYDITMQNLIDDGVYPIIWYRVYSKRLKQYVVIRPQSPSYAYTQFYDKEGNQIKGKAKIYTPAVKGRGKWVTNCTENEIGGLELIQIFDHTHLIITKSYKDYRVLTNLGYQCIWVQNEGMIPSKIILEFIEDYFQEVFIFFDNDETGIKASDKFSKAIKSTSITLPVELLREGIKDASDTYEKLGKEYLSDWMKTMIYLTEEFKDKLPF